MEDVRWAYTLSRQLLAEPLPRRWAHTQGVATAAESIAAVAGDEADLLIDAAWLHDIGYAPDLVVTGFHPLDGARYLRDVARADARLCQLVANHSCASIEARNRGLADLLLAEFPEDGELIGQALTYCDMTTSPDGEPVDPEARLREIVNRYGDGHVVSRSMRQAQPCVQSAASTVRALMAVS